MDHLGAPDLLVKRSYVSPGVLLQIFKDVGYSFLSGTVSPLGVLKGGFAAAVTTPLDVAKTRIMLAKVFSSAEREPVGEAWIAEVTGGSLFAGVVPRMAAISLGGFIFLGTYEKTRQLLL
ncbi:hypothetical protein IHE44_0003604 [Lamprotornis superbus]|uniref:Mitochondrial S-adenosylmethionine carrier protein n=1 Tax=Lamprotornis superbus TaxID=245042 RepID=A0A835P162_9PASS|nr:hypothetical protein IHE44_0003604 [Lamprotornis superbus]